jgi:hypothetical protein
MTFLVARLLESHTHDGEISDEDMWDIKGLASALYIGKFVSYLWAA